MPEDMSEYMPEDMSDRMPEDMSEYLPEDMPDRMPEDMSDRVPEDMPDRMPDRMPERMPEDMPDHMPEDMPDRMSNRMSEDMSDRMPEDLPVRKCINVMVGITRSKVICRFCAKVLCTEKVSGVAESDLHTQLQCTTLAASKIATYMRGRREENIMKHSKLSNFHGFLGVSIFDDDPKRTRRFQP